MPSQTEIIEALTMDFINAAAPFNGSGDAAFTLTFQFDDSLPTDDFSGFDGWRAWKAAEKNAVLAALAHIETFLNVEFVEVTGNADPDLNLGMVSLPGATAGYGGAMLWTYGDGSFADYDAFAVFDKTLDLAGNPNLILHELGHALGLDHPFEGTVLAAAYDTNHNTVMSYDADPESGDFNDAMMLYDLLALQAIWGAAEYNTSNTTYTGPRTGNVDAIWDTGGTDTFDASARSGAVSLDLRDGRFSSFGGFEDVAIAYGVTIENAIGGSGNDRLTGNAVANRLSGNDGNDIIKGNGGADDIDGGKGKDVLKGGSGGDTLSGGGGKDVIRGGGGGDTLAGGKGSDKLWGGAGVDTFVFAAGADRDVIRDFEAGVDTLEFTGLGPLSEVLALADESGGDTYFDFGDGDLLILRDVTLAALTGDLSVA